MDNVNWLHISDLHILGNDPEWKNYREYLFQVMDENKLKPDFVIITGDYRNIWKDESFIEAERFIRELMKLLDLELSCDLFIVPGNHDLQPQQHKHLGIKKIDADVRTNELRKLMPDGIEPWERKKDEEDWLKKNEKNPSNYIDRLCGIKRNSEEDKNIVNIQYLLNGFNSYEDMAKELIPWYREKGIAPAVVHCRTWEKNERLQLNLVHINTVLAADGSRCHYQALDLINTQNILQGIKNGMPTIILAHNSFYDLHPEIRKHLLPEMESANVCAWLCGDRHRVDMKSEIPCSNGKDVIPIIVCGKAAPDNADAYSENGFFFYTWNGQEVDTKYFQWSLSGDNKKKPTAYKCFPASISRKSFSKRKKLYIGYLSCNPNVTFQEKYHLGHAYFIHKIDEIRREDNYVVIFTSSYILGNNRNRELIKRDNEYAANMIQKWKKCFGEEVEIVDIRRQIGCGIPDGANIQQCINYVSDMEFRLSSEDKANAIIEKWYQTKVINDNEYFYIKDFFKVDYQHKYEKEEILSFAYLIYKRPMWYNSTWLINFIGFWNRQMYHYVRTDLGIDVEPSEIFIIEATRNNYVWNAISYCAKKFDFINFPAVEYFQNLLDTDCEQPMKSSNQDKVFLLKDYDNDKAYSNKFEDHVRKMFGTSKSSAKIAEEYFKRLCLGE